jgi:hypothetical protein
MEKINNKIWTLRKDILKKRASAVGNIALGIIMVPLEIINHLNPIYWVYKVATYNPSRKRELDSLDFFDDAKHALKKAKESSEELTTAKDERQDKKDEEIQEILDTNPLSGKVLEYARDLLIKLGNLSVKEQKAYILKIQRVLATYAYRSKELEDCPNEIYSLNEKTIKKLAIIEESLNMTLANNCELSQNLESEETKTLSLDNTQDQSFKKNK